MFRGTRNLNISKHACSDKDHLTQVSERLKASLHTSPRKHEQRVKQVNNFKMFPYTMQVRLLFVVRQNLNDTKTKRKFDTGTSSNTRVVRKIKFPRRCSREERCYAGSGDTGV
jgi:hypothetical protein